METTETPLIPRSVQGVHGPNRAPPMSYRSGSRRRRARGRRRARKECLRGKARKKKNAWCCSLDCVARFCSTVDDDGAQLHNAAFLRKEQAIFANLSSEKESKSFVIGRGMMAANTPVCNLAFRKLFGVSETLISACKGTPLARASSCAEVGPSRRGDSKSSWKRASRRVTIPLNTVIVLRAVRFL